jgi:BirA family biotin operon repressor/biotin-[acetyl-CoA-carboxylase] ligase
MAVYTKNPGYAAALLPEDLLQRLAPVESLDPSLEPLGEALFGGPEGLLTSPLGFPEWESVFLAEFSPRSQYDQLITLARGEPGLPDRTVCLAGAGRDFHGFKGRYWAAVPGNLHLAIHLAPRRSIDRFGVAFTILAALSVTEAIAEVPSLEAPPQIKWVNDILLADAKVGGILAYTQSQGTKVSSVVLGIGLNVDTTPKVEPTPFVPQVAALKDFLPNPGPGLRKQVLSRLLQTLARNYQTLLEKGVGPLLEKYRDLSVVIGKEVTICTEVSDRTLQIVTEGRVASLGENLEIFLEDHPQPISGGRLAMGPARNELNDWVARAPAGAPARLTTGRGSAD